MKSLVIDCGIHLTRKLLEVVIWYFLKTKLFDIFDKTKKLKSNGRSYIDFVPKFSCRNFVDGRDIQVDDENVTDDQKPYHDEQVEEAPPE